MIAQLPDSSFGSKLLREKNFHQANSAQRMYLIWAKHSINRIKIKFTKNMKKVVNIARGNSGLTTDLKSSLNYRRGSRVLVY